MLSKAIVGGGCFWCTETIFLRLRGVHKVESGYAGGHVKDPTYKQICEGNTGHAEVIRVFYDPQVISYKSKFTKLFSPSLHIFQRPWSHNSQPTRKRCRNSIPIDNHVWNWRVKENRSLSLWGSVKRRKLPRRSKQNRDINRSGRHILFSRRLSSRLL